MHAEVFYKNSINIIFGSARGRLQYQVQFQKQTYQYMLNSLARGKN